MATTADCDFLGALPWRLGSLAALLVGVVSFASGAADTWVVLARVGMAFAAFFVVGWLVKAVLSIACDEALTGGSGASKSDYNENAAVSELGSDGEVAL